MLRPALLVAAAVGAFGGVAAVPCAADVTIAVRSLNPASGVAIGACCGQVCTLQVTPTPYDLVCPAGSTVNLSASAIAGPSDDTPFTEWRWGTPPTFFASQRATQVTVDASETLTAVYGNPPPVVTYPDFAVDSIALNPSSPVSGTTFSATVVVSNHGEGQIASAYLAIWKDRADTPECRPAQDDFKYFGYLAAGGSQTLTFTNLLAGPAGAATFRAFADFSCGFAEGDEADNHATLAYVVQPRRTLNVSSETPSSGVSITANPADLIGRTGAATFFSRFYADGQSVTLTAPATAAGNIFQHWRKDGVVLADTAAVVVAMDADRNLTAVYAPPPLPNFVVTGLALPDYPTAGFAFRASVTVKNQGTVAGDGETLSVWTDKIFNNSCNWADATTWRSVGTLAAGESRTFDFTGLGPLTATGSTRYFRAYVDSTCSTTELSDTDNQSTKDYQVLNRQTKSVIVDTLDGRHADIAHTMDVTGEVGGSTRFTRTYPTGAVVTLTAPPTTPDGGVFQKWTGLEPVVPTTPEVTFAINYDKGVKAVYVGPGEPDFAVTSLVLDPPNPPAGGTFTASVTIKNVGTGRGVPGSLDLFPDRSTPAGCWAGTIYGPMYIYDLAAGASLTFTVPSIPAGARGAKQILAFVDSFCETGEPDEANNQVFFPYEAVNAPPRLEPIGDQAAVEGTELVFTVAPGDPDDDTPLTLEAANLPPGATFDPPTGIFRWTPGFDQSGRHEGVVFTVTDPSGATAAETIAIEVAEPAGPVFADDFSDPAPAIAAGGDPWLPLTGSWSRDGGVYTATSGKLSGLSRVALLDPEALPLGAGIVQARVKLAGTARSRFGPNALIVFGFAGPDHYRWVRLSEGKVQIGQSGDIDGITGGAKRGAAISVRTGRWYLFTVRIEPDGWVRVYRGVGTKPIVAYRFATAAGTPSVVPGGVGLATSKAKAVFDDVVVWEESAFFASGGRRGALAPAPISGSR